MLRSKQTIIALIAFSTIAFSAPKTFVYILKFENTERDESVDWLAQGFVDMLNAQLTNQQGVVLKNRQDLEVIMDNRSLMLHQPRGSKNLLLLGKFSRSLDNIQINIQLIDVATWEEADRRKISEKYNEIPKLNIKLTEAIQTMLTPFLPKIAPSKYPALLESKPSPMDKSYARSSSEVGIEIDKSLEALEASMDIMAGARGIPIKPNYKKSGGEWSMDITSDPFISGDPDMAEAGKDGAALSSVRVRTNANADFGALATAFVGTIDPGADANRVRYDSAKFSGFSVHGDLEYGGGGSVGAKYSGTVAGLTLKAGIGYEADGGGTDMQGASVAVKHSSGLHLALNYGEQNVDASTADPEWWRIAGGYDAKMNSLGNTNFTVAYSEKEDETVKGYKGEMLQVAVKQSLDAVGGAIVLQYDNYSFSDAANTGLKDIDAVVLETSFNF